MTRQFKPRTPCLDCGKPSYGTRCLACHRAQQPPGRPRRPGLSNSWKERRRRRDAVEAHRAEHGDWCPGYGVPAHASGRLCADHVIPVGQGGTENGPLAILCVSCNSRKRDGRPPIAKGPNKPAAPPAVRPAKPRSQPPVGDPVRPPAVKEVPPVAPSPPPEPPVPFKAGGRRLWDSVTSRYDLEAHETALLVEAARTIDLLDELAARIESDGLMVPVLPHGEKVNPAVIEARQQKIALARIQAALRLPAGDEEDDSGELRRPQRRVGVRGVYAIKGGGAL